MALEWTLLFQCCIEYYIIFTMVPEFWVKDFLSDCNEKLETSFVNQD